MPSRPADVFFYGLFMDKDLLRSKGLRPDRVEGGSVEGLALRIGERATLVPERGGRVHGLVMSLTQDELTRLYSDPGLQAYQPQAVLVDLESGGRVAAMCYNLSEPPSPSERNPEYAARLRALAEKIGLPGEYVSRIH